MRKLLIGLCIWAAFGCVRNPVTGKHEIVLISENEEIAMGRQSHDQVRAEYGFVDQKNAQAYVETLGRKLAAVSHRPELDWHFTVVDSPVVNAFALPGGYVYLTRGILAYINNEAELAAVMGHEIGHVTARHTVRQMTRTQLTQIGIGVGSVVSPTFGQLGNMSNHALGLLFLRFSRDDEREADRLGVEYAAKAGYDPREVSNFFEVLRHLSQAEDRESIPGFLSTHPDPGERVETTRALAREWIERLDLLAGQMIVNRDNHFRNIDGLVFGNNPRDGFTEGDRFYHPDLAFQITFPGNWRVENTRTVVSAIGPQQTGLMQLSAVQASRNTTTQDYLRQLESRGIRPESGEQITIHGNRAFLGIFMLSGQNGGRVPVMAAFIEYRQRLYQILGTANDFRSYRSTIEQSIRSFQSLTDSRILRAEPDRLAIATAREGDTLASIGAQFKNPRVGEPELAVLNRLVADQPLTPGRLVKIVEPGY
jgi:predicted Zn-dependent protease